MKVALAHDYLREYGGAERVLEALHDIFPEAPVFTAYLNLKKLGIHAKRFSDWDIHTSWMQKIPFADKFLSPTRIFAPMMFESFDLDGFNVVISSCNIYFAKAVLTGPNCLHISYIHTPPRYLYGFTTSFNYKKHWWTKIGAEIVNHFLRLYDFETSQRPDILVANSETVKERIKKFYRREAVVIYPPVDLAEFGSTRKTGGAYFLALNRLSKGKGTDIIVQACTKLGLPLKVVGSGPELKNLQKIAGSSIDFLGEVSDAERVKLYLDAKALVVASEEEDFGITAVESMAAGTPVIAIGSGGYKETVIKGKTGEFFSPQNPLDGLMGVLEKFKPEKYRDTDCRKQAERFSKEKFKRQVLELVEENLKTRKFGDYGG